MAQELYNGYGSCSEGTGNDGVQSPEEKKNIFGIVKNAVKEYKDWIAQGEYETAYQLTLHFAELEVKEYEGSPEYQQRLDEAIAEKIEMTRYALNLGMGMSGGIEIVEGAGSSINTPYGKAIQSNSKEALQLRQTVDNGGQLYRTGTFGKSNVTDAQFWAPENPLSSGYANKYGLANSQVDYVIGGTKVPGAPCVTRPAPPVPPNLGGGIEVVTNPNSVRLNFFHMPE